MPCSIIYKDCLNCYFGAKRASTRREIGGHCLRWAPWADDLLVFLFPQPTIAQWYSTFKTITQRLILKDQSGLPVWKKEHNEKKRHNKKPMKQRQKIISILFWNMRHMTRQINTERPVLWHVLSFTGFPSICQEETIPLQNMVILTYQIYLLTLDT